MTDTWSSSPERTRPSGRAPAPARRAPKLLLRLRAQIALRRARALPSTPPFGYVAFRDAFFPEEAEEEGPFLRRLCLRPRRVSWKSFS